MTWYLYTTTYSWKWNIWEREDKDYLDPIDVAYIYNEDKEDNPILQWLQENREPILNKESISCFNITAY